MSSPVPASSPQGPRKRGATLPADASRAGATIQDLLETAERLFEEKGVDHVSLRQIVLASKQKNLAALHYHFGSRAHLVTELLRIRREHVNARRHRHLDALASRPGPVSLRDVVSASIHALADTVAEEPWGRSYVSVLAQTTFSPQLRADGVTLTAISGVLRVHELIGSALPDLDADTLQRRLTWFTQNIVYSLALWCRTHDDLDPPAYAAYVEDLVDFCVGGLQAEPRAPGIAVPGVVGRSAP